MKRTIILSSFILALALPVPVRAQGPYDPPWSSVDNGGDLSAGSVYTLSGTIAQPDAGRISGSTYALNGGFWAGVAEFIRTEAPDVPVLVCPVDNTITSTAQLTLTWQASAGASGYLVDFNGSVSDVGNVTGYDTGVLVDGTYTWTVAVYDAPSNTSAYADTWSFTIIAYCIYMPYVTRNG
jgi:hypothetical protein